MINLKFQGVLFLLSKAELSPQKPIFYEKKNVTQSIRV